MNDSIPVSYLGTVPIYDDMNVDNCRMRVYFGTIPVKRIFWGDNLVWEEPELLCHGALTILEIQNFIVE